MDDKRERREEVGYVTYEGHQKGPAVDEGGGGPRGKEDAAGAGGSGGKPRFSVTSAGWILAYLVLAVCTVVVPLYFLGVSRPGRAMISNLVEDNVHGKVELGSMALDPFGRAVSLVDLVIADRENMPVVQVGGAGVVADSLADNAFEQIVLRDSKLIIVLDEEGRLNLQDLIKEKEAVGPREPEGFRIDRLVVGESAVLIDTPYAVLGVGPIGLSGNLSQLPDQFPVGALTGRIDRLGMVIRHSVMVDLFSGLFGGERSYEFGPLSLDLELKDGRIRFSDTRLEFPGTEVHMEGEIDPVRQLGELLFVVNSGGIETASFGASLEEQAWSLALRVNSLSVPKVSNEGIYLPGFEISGLSFKALKEQCTLGLNRLLVKELELGELEAGEVALSGRLHFESGQPLDEMALRLDGQADPWAGLTHAMGQWKRGELFLSLVVQSLVHDREQLAAPLDLRLEVMPRKDGSITVDLDLTASPNGIVQIDVVIEPETEEGLRPYQAEVRLNRLNLPPILRRAEMSGMVKNMLGGRLTGKIRFGGTRLGSPLLEVEECRFDLAGAPGPFVFLCPEEKQTWDMSADVGVSLFSREVKFGNGRLLIRTKL